MGIYPISDNCVREYTLWLSGRALDYWPGGPGSILTKSWDFFQPNLLCFVLCYGSHVVRTRRSSWIISTYRRTNHGITVINSFLLQWTLFMTTFVITANIVITSVWSAQKSADRVFFQSRNSHVILRENIRFVYLLESHRRGDSNKYTKPMIHKKIV